MVGSVAHEDAKAWMACEDMITRLKDELILEAVDILHVELKEGHIDITGYVSLLPDKSDELQRDMYIIGNLIERENEMTQQYRPFIESMEHEKDPKKLASIEELRKFMLSVHAISELMKMSSIAGRWADDTGKYSDSDDQVKIIVSTARMADERIEVVDFVLSSKRFLKSEALTDRELDMLRDARKAIG